MQVDRVQHGGEYTPDPERAAKARITCLGKNYESITQQSREIGRNINTEQEGSRWIGGFGHSDYDEGWRKLDSDYKGQEILAHPNVHVRGKKKRMNQDSPGRGDS